MEGLPLLNLVSSAHSCFLVRGHQPNKLSNRHPRISIKTRKFCIRIGYSRLVHCSKISDYQDFQGYARPLRLLPATEPKICTQSLLEEMSTSIKVDKSRSVYVVKLRTSNFSGSGLSDLNAGVLLCLIDENGDSILQRMAATPMKETALSDMLHFQRGFVDEFTFEGPKLGKIEALWIGLESGCWRFGGASLTVVHECQAPSDDTEEDGRKVTQNSGLKYEFEAEDILVGGSGDMSMVELRPCHVAELSVIEPLTLLNMGLSQSTSLLNHERYNEESMKEYADLKFSLLFYDAMLIFAGTSITAISTDQEAAFAFLTGGAGGFLYLLLLQRSVDGLPTPTSISMNRGGNLNQLFGQLKGLISSLAFSFVFSVLAVKYSSGATPIVLAPQEILVGMTGFLMCKLAVVLAAFRPIPIRLKENS